jgi:hypothetical protein
MYEVSMGMQSATVYVAFGRWNSYTNTKAYIYFKTSELVCKEIHLTTVRQDMLEAECM